ncbi:MAG: disulfide bond formation protein B [Chlamydiia bacterium]|nr:disulfide bond formation protein B [Chlamydiia bacterium]
MKNLEANLNALMIWILAGVLFGAFGVQYFLQEEPCPLCLLQRIGMLGVATGGILNIQFGCQRSHYGLILLSCLCGASVAIRQITLHICPGFPQFGLPVFGLSLYTWSFLVFACTILLTAILLILHTPQKPAKNLFQKLAIYLILLATFGNVIWTLIECGLGGCPE